MKSMKLIDKESLAALFSGLIFGVGLIVSGMIYPQKVLNFLDIFGSWDPSLAFVMMGAIGIHFFTYKWARGNKNPILVKGWNVPTKTQITPSLLIGAVLFGVGWGLVGLCPGPAFVSVFNGNISIFIFLVSLLIGMFIFKLIDRKIHFNR